MLVRVWRKGNPLTLLVGMQTSTLWRARASSCDEGETTWFFSSCDGIVDLRRGLQEKMPRRVDPNQELGLELTLRSCRMLLSKGVMTGWVHISKRGVLLTGEDAAAGRDCGQEGKGAAEGAMAEWHHRLHGHGFGED